MNPLDVLLQLCLSEPWLHLQNQRNISQKRIACWRIIQAGATWRSQACGVTSSQSRRGAMPSSPRATKSCTCTVGGAALRFFLSRSSATLAIGSPCVYLHGFACTSLNASLCMYVPKMAEHQSDSCRQSTAAAKKFCDADPEEVMGSCDFGPPFVHVVSESCCSWQKPFTFQLGQEQSFQDLTREGRQRRVSFFHEPCFLKLPSKSPPQSGLCQFRHRKVQTKREGGIREEDTRCVG